jgi:ATP-dependent Clp protease ATP-binding subunit ClpB
VQDIILYRSLSRSDIRKVVEVRLKEIQLRLEANGRKIKLAVDDYALDWLGAAGYSRECCLYTFNSAYCIT